MADEKVTQAHVAETGKKYFAVTINVSDNTLAGDEPEDAGGKTLAPRHTTFFSQRLENALP